jgi:hypothetical protein
MAGNSGNFGGPASHTSTIVNGVITVNSGSYNSYQFTAPSGATGISISGSFTASGGSGNDIDVYVMDQSDFTNWENGHQASALYDSGQETTGNFNVALTPGVTYDLV